MERKQLLAMNAEAGQAQLWLRHQADAWSGSGGYAPIYSSQVHSAGGAAPSIDPSTDSPRSYLRKHMREEEQSYLDRRCIARYPNHVRRLGRLWLGLFFKRPPTRPSTLPHSVLDDFHADADGRGRGIDEFVRAVASHAFQFSVGLALLDADAEGNPFASLVHPATLYDWEFDADDELAWVKTVDEVSVRASPTDAAMPLLRCRVWTREESQTWWAIRDDVKADPWQEDDGTIVHGLGVVPIVRLHWDDPDVPGALFGFTPATELAGIGREDFEDLSRLREIQGKTAFPTLIVPVESGAAQKAMASLVVGPALGLPIDKDSTQGYQMLSPADGPIMSYERKRSINDAEATKVLGMETLLNSSAVPSSALAREYETEHRNAELGRFGHRVQAFDEALNRMVLLRSGLNEAAVAKSMKAYRVTMPDEFGARDKQEELRSLSSVLAEPGIDPVSRRVALQRFRDIVLDMGDKEMVASDTWLLAQQALEEMSGDRAGGDMQVDTAEPGDAAGSAVAGPAGGARIEITPSAQIDIVSMNEARASIGLRPMTLPDGSRDPDGDLSVSEFRAKREALRAAQARDAEAASAAIAAIDG